ncbi:MAG: hypothetical protein IPM74_04545 [Crocinitomicaceae bacterium]|nr:hypothetical protein [Crocinitomicaceae bacterium]
MLITVETVFEGGRTHLSSSDYVFHSSAMQQGDDWYFPKYTELTGFLDTSFYVVNSPVSVHQNISLGHQVIKIRKHH